jgi:hypothetical protein
MRQSAGGHSLSSLRWKEWTGPWSRDEQNRGRAKRPSHLDRKRALRPGSRRGECVECAALQMGDGGVVGAGACSTRWEKENCDLERESTTMNCSFPKTPCTRACPPPCPLTPSGDADRVPSLILASGVAARGLQPSGERDLKLGRSLTFASRDTFSRGRSSPPTRRAGVIGLLPKGWRSRPGLGRARRRRWAFWRPLRLGCTSSSPDPPPTLPPPAAPLRPRMTWLLGQPDRRRRGEPYELFAEPNASPPPRARRRRRGGLWSRRRPALLLLLLLVPLAGRLHRDRGSRGLEGTC